MKNIKKNVQINLKKFFFNKQAGTANRDKQGDNIPDKSFEEYLDNYLFTTRWQTI